MVFQRERSGLPASNMENVTVKAGWLAEFTCGNDVKIPGQRSEDGAQLLRELVTADSVSMAENKGCPRSKSTIQLIHGTPAAYPPSCVMSLIDTGPADSE